ncbi:MAG TPA: RNA polymerase sigma factor [Candidatus Mcinerneyibacterium sp.]|nr:RNA polymerase sigma factor [Candidatus Mcinerneyibacterium sp.]
MGKNYKEFEDIKLIHLMKDGDIKAFEVIFERYRTFVRKLAYSFSREENIIEEIVQNSFLKVYKKIDQFKENSKFTSWLYVIVKNEGRMYLREKEKRKKFKNIENPMDKFEKADKKTMDEKVELKELKRKVKMAIDELPDHYQNILEKVAFEGKKYKEVASELNLTISQVKSRLYRARKKLKKMIDKYIKYTRY